MNHNSMTAWRQARHSLASDKRLILACINKGMNDGRGGATCDEIEEATGLLHQTASARMNDLMNEGVIAPVPGMRRLTRRRRPADVYAMVYARTQVGAQVGAQAAFAL